MQTLNELFEKQRMYWADEEINFFKKLIEEIEALKKQRIPEPENLADWITPSEFCAKYPAFSPGYLGVLRTNCSVKQQKFFKGGSYDAKYNAKETFRYIMSLPHGKTRVQNILVKNNFYGINLEE